MTVQNCPLALTKLADETLETMLPVAAKETARRYGSFQGDYAVIALGKGGGRELSLASDLDVMMIYDAPAETQPIFTRLTQSLVGAVSSVTAEGRLYELDMALRPSGRSGPVALVSPHLKAITAKGPGHGSSWRSRARASSPLAHQTLFSVSQA